MKLLLCSQEKKNGSFFFFSGKMSDKPKQKYRVIKFVNDVREKNRVCSRFQRNRISFPFYFGE